MNHVEFLNHLFTGTDGYMDITGIKPVTGDVFTRCYRIGQDRPDWNKIMQANANGWGIYYGATTKNAPRWGHQRGTEKTAHILSALWAEIDLKEGYYKTIDDAQKAVYDLMEPPTVLIHSGGGIHALWRITPLEIASDNIFVIKEVLRGLANYLHADKKVADLARVLRLPGTINTKPDRNGALCHVVDALPGELTFDQFLHYRKYAQPEQRPIEREFPLPQTDDDAKAAIIWYERHGNEPHNRNSRLYWTACALRDNGMSEEDALSHLLPVWVSFGKDAREGEKSIGSAYKGKRGTPSYVNENEKTRLRAGDRLRNIQVKS